MPTKNKTRQPKIVLRGKPALETGRPLFVETLDGHWVPAGPLARERGERMSRLASTIYGVEAAPSRLVTRWQISYQRRRGGDRVIGLRLYTYAEALERVRRLRKLQNDAYLAGSLRVRLEA